MALEKVMIEINLDSRWWNKPPRTKVWLDNIVLQQATEVTGPLKITWEGFLDEGEHEIKVSLMGKENISETILDEKGHIIKDQILSIKSVILDEIDVEMMLYDFSSFAAKTGEIQNKTIDLGFNGDWTFKFSVPVYQWLLERWSP